ncbi:MAG: ThuA domain-containing protein [Clostridia bacterium]|nr:ThuA domain-containing protein [Clostridia bacterium]
MLNILLLCDDKWHPGEVFERGLVRPLSQKGVHFDVVKAPRDILTKEMIRTFDVIINARGHSYSAANPAAWFSEGETDVMPEDLADYVREGGGFLALHGGNTYKTDRLPTMTELIGNDFIGHPKMCPIRAFPVGSHPITQGIEPCMIRDEHYMLDIHCEDADVFYKSTSDTEAGTQIAGYTRNYGEGRICVLTPGHTQAVLETEAYAKVLYNAILWCAKQI